MTEVLRLNKHVGSIGQAPKKDFVKRRPEPGRKQLREREQGSVGAWLFVSLVCPVIVLLRLLILLGMDTEQAIPHRALPRCPWLLRASLQGRQERKRVTGHIIHFRPVAIGDQARDTTEQ